MINPWHGFCSDLEAAIHDLCRAAEIADLLIADEADDELSRFAVRQARDMADNLRKQFREGWEKAAAGKPDIAANTPTPTNPGAATCCATPPTCSLRYEAAGRAHR